MKTDNCLRFFLDGQEHRVDFSQHPDLRPSTTLLTYLRSLRGHKGVKEGCAEGDCGACTVVLAEADENNGLRYYAVNSCLLFLPLIHGKQVITVENLARHENGTQVLHPVQQQLVDHHGSQCGYCTPGFVMSLFALYKNHRNPTRHTVEEALAGNLCRCTGYRPIIEAGLNACMGDGSDHFTADEKRVAEILRCILLETPSLSLEGGKQRYHRPATLAEALDLRAHYPEATVINGSTDVALRQTKKHEKLEHLLDLSGIGQLNQIQESTSSYSIGSGYRLEALRTWSENRLPVLHQMLNVFASLQIRHIATIGGNIGSASPIGDLLPVMIALNASVALQSSTDQRNVTLEKFIQGYRKTDLQPNEIIREIIVPKPHEHTQYWSHKISKRKDLDISTVSACFRLHITSEGLIDDIALVYGGMAECTRRAVKTEKHLIGQRWDASTVYTAAEQIAEDFSPITDARSGKEFRLLAARNLLIRFFIETQHLS